MMATTHALAGLLLASLTALVAPALAIPAAIGGVLGGLFPDFDLYWGHRRTLHFPVYYPILAVPFVGIALLTPTGPTVALATFVVAAGLHSSGDALGGGLELRPWHGTSQRAVYNHHIGHWIAPRRWIRYDGAPEDLGLAILLAIPSVIVYDGAIETLVLVGLAVSAVYVAIRKPLAWVSEHLIDLVPGSIRPYVPERLFSP